MPTHPAEIVESLSWLRLRPMIDIDNPRPFRQIQGRLKSVSVLNESLSVNTP